MPTRKQFEQKVAGALTRVVPEGEPIVASGYALVHPGTKKVALSNIPALARVRHYWVALTPQRLVLVNLGQGLLAGGEPAVEQAEPRASVALERVDAGFFGVELHVRLGESPYHLRFGGGYRRDAKAIAGALGPGA